MNRQRSMTRQTRKSQRLALTKMPISKQKQNGRAKSMKPSSSLTIGTMCKTISNSRRTPLPKKSRLHKTNSAEQPHVLNMQGKHPKEQPLLNRLQASLSKTQRFNQKISIARLVSPPQMRASNTPVCFPTMVQRLQALQSNLCNTTTTTTEECSSRATIWRLVTTSSRLSKTHRHASFSVAI